MIKTINELLQIKSFGERYEYLRIDGSVGESTFGFDRYLNQMLYRSREWLRTRDLVIIRDDGCDLAMPDWPIKGRIIVHHMNPISIEDIEFTITTSLILIFWFASLRILLSDSFQQ